jgi:hypothetical protein
MEKHIQTMSVSMEALEPLFRERLAAGQQVRFSPMGTSMLPMLREGRDSVVLSPPPKKLRPFDLALYRRDSGAYVLHRITAVGQTYTCMGDNQFVSEDGLRHDQIIALVTGFRRNGRDHSVTEPGYRLYCFLWHYSRPLRRFWRRGLGWLRRHL